MRFKLAKKDKNTLRVDIQDKDETFFRPLIERLMEDEAVEEVRYGEGHLQLDEPWIFIKVKIGKPQSSLKRALRALSNQYKEARESAEKAL